MKTIIGVSAILLGWFPVFGIAAPSTLGPVVYEISVTIEGCNNGVLDCFAGENAIFHLQWDSGQNVNMDLSPGDPSRGNAEWNLNGGSISLTTQSGATYSWSQTGDTWALFLANEDPTTLMPDEFRLGGGRTFTGNDFDFNVRGGSGLVPDLDYAANSLEQLDFTQSTYDNSSARFAFNQADFIVNDIRVQNISTVPIPATVWLFGSAVIGLAGMSKRVRA